MLQAHAINRMPSFYPPLRYLLAHAINRIHRRTSSVLRHPFAFAALLNAKGKTFRLLARFGFSRSRVDVRCVELASESFARFLLSLVLVSFQLLCLLARVDFDSSAFSRVLASFLASGRCIGHAPSKNVHRAEQCIVVVQVSLPLRCPWNAFTAAAFHGFPWWAGECCRAGRD